jgi:2-iminobutanoate/2-iminopropanoate deaminase
VELIGHDPADAPAPQGGYVNAMEVRGAQRLVFVSGQIPEDRDGAVPDDLEGQCRRVWANVRAGLAAAGLGIADVVKVTTFLGDRASAAVNTRVRQEVLAGHRPALTVVIAEIFDPRWALEVEVIAAG